MQNNGLKVVRGDIARVSWSGQDNDQLYYIHDKIERHGRVVGYLCVPIIPFVPPNQSHPDNKYSMPLTELSGPIYCFKKTLKEVSLSDAQVTSLKHASIESQNLASEIVRDILPAQTATRRATARHHGAVTTIVPDKTMPDISIKDAKRLNYFAHSDTAYLLDAANVTSLKTAYDLALAKDQTPLHEAHKSLSIPFISLAGFRQDITFAYLEFQWQAQEQPEDFPSDVKITYPVLRPA